MRGIFAGLNPKPPGKMSEAFGVFAVGKYNRGKIYRKPLEGGVFRAKKLVKVDDIKIIHAADHKGLTVSHEFFYKLYGFCAGYLGSVHVRKDVLLNPLAWAGGVFQFHIQLLSRELDKSYGDDLSLIGVQGGELRVHEYDVV